MRRCKQCKRARYPGWTLCADNTPFRTGDVLRVESKQHQGRALYFVTAIDYLHQTVDVVEMTREEHKTNAGRRRRLSRGDFATSRHMVQMESERETYMSFRNMLVCGECGNVSHMATGEDRDVLRTEAQTRAIEGELRMAKQSLGEAEKDYQYCKRRWLERKKGYKVGWVDGGS